MNGMQRFSSSSTPVMVRKPATRPRSVFKSEIALLDKIKQHKNVLVFLGAVWEPATQMMQLFEVCGNGNLRDFIRKVVNIACDACAHCDGSTAPTRPSRCP